MGAVEPDAVVAAVRAALPDVLLAVDFDGTLAPLVPDPQRSRPVPGTVDALSAVARRGAQVAVITGRDAATVVRLGGMARVPGLIVAGLYGIETWHDGVLDTPDIPGAIEAARARLPGLLAANHADPLVWIEDKRLSLVVHGRRAADPDAALAPLRAPIQALADDLGLEMHPGRDVLELRVPGFDKAGALLRLAGDRAGVLFAGDDLGDVPAFTAVAELRRSGRAAYGIAVLSSGVAGAAEAADAHVAVPADLVAVLARLGRPA